ncbi:hypothetical protein SCLCIDRAFT_26704 [Scleroderma citrinum Foug A]|uniref:Uncharacterized protein n=1 Tax=Scleroderma citrinum Foug A TaxID=1036808 RepID=A0A0C3DI35_9AGAM|nr:hypothetical protein SCLCIDRAFT_26704 [Scleroderma citrinum Foug A]
MEEAQAFFPTLLDGTEALPLLFDVPHCHDRAQPPPRPSHNSDPSPATPKLIAVPQLNPGHYVNLRPRTSFIDKTPNLVWPLLDPQLYYSSIPDATPIPGPGLPHTFFLARSLV